MTPPSFFVNDCSQIAVDSSRRVLAILTACLLVGDPCRIGCTSPTLIGFVVELRLHFLCPYSMIDSEEDVKSAFLPSVKYTLPSQNLSPSLTSVFTTLLLEPLICTHLHSIVLLLPCVPSTRPLGLIKMRRNHLSNLPNSILFSFSPFPPSFPLPFLLLSFDELFGECFTPLPPLALLVSSFLSAPLTMFFPSLICLFLVLASPPLFSLPWAFVTPSFPLVIFSTTFFSSLVSDPPAEKHLTLLPVTLILRRRGAQALSLAVFF